MMENIIFKIFITLGFIGLATQYIITKKRHSQSYREHLEPVLKKNNLKFLSSRFPGWFKVGPFPKLEGEVGRPQSKVPFLGRGEYSQYRIIKVQGRKGKNYQIWAMLTFELFRLRDIRWRVFPGDPFPEEAINLLENR